MRAITCPICGRKFETARPNKKYCSLICREAGKQLKRIYWETENPNYNANYYQSHKAMKEASDTT